MEKPSEEEMSRYNLRTAVRKHCSRDIESELATAQARIAELEKSRNDYAAASAEAIRLVTADGCERIAVLEGLLRWVEWSDHVDGWEDYCPICGNDKHEGHAPDCRWAAAMGKEPTP